MRPCKRATRRAFLRRAGITVGALAMAGEPSAQALAAGPRSQEKGLPALPPRLRGVQLSEGIRWSDPKSPHRQRLSEMQGWGVNLMRIFIRPFGLSDKTRSLKELVLYQLEKELDFLVEWCSGNGVWLQLAFYPESQWGPKAQVKWPDPKEGLPSLWYAERGAQGDNEQAQAALAETWQAVTEKLKGRPFIMLDLLNEPSPHGVEVAQAWNRLYPLLLDAVRKADPARWVAVECAEWAHPEGMAELEPATDSGVIYNFHFYKPFMFTHQGSDNMPRGQGYPGSYPNYPGEPPRWWDKAALKEMLEPAVEFQRRTGARMMMSEGGAISYAPLEDRIRWTRDAIDLFEEYGIDWAWHRYGTPANWAFEDTPQLVAVLREYFGRNRG